MKHFAFLAILLLTIGGASGSLAVAGGDAFAHAHGSHSECPLPKSAADVVACAVSESPIAKRSRLAADQSKSLVEVARQIPNPEIDIQSATGRQDGGEASSTDIGLLQPIEWGGRREARISSAEAQGKILNAEEREVQADLVRETIRNLHRLRQLEVEKTLLIETVETLQRIISQQTSRPALTPDQQVTLTVYRMALADTKIKQSEMFEEERKLEHYFHVSTGHSLTELKPILPSA
ncbi:MAG: TolC family protein, partial [Bdellovibrionales bacterium]|nr:TolC family protein [Bdellovibrionales bacterium]